MGDVPPSLRSGYVGFGGIMNWFAQYLLKPVLGLGGLAGTGYIYHRAISAASSTSEAFTLFGAAVGVLLVSMVLVHGVEWMCNRDNPVVRLGHFTHVSDYKESAGDKSWKENYSTSVLRLPRPRSGARIHRVHCHACSHVDVEVWSYLRALRNKVLVVLIYALYGFYWILLVHIWPAMRENAHGLVKSVVAISGFAGLFPGIPVALAGLNFLLTSWVGTESGVGSSVFFFLGSRTIGNEHKIFSL